MKARIWILLGMLAALAVARPATAQQPWDTGPANMNRGTAPTPPPLDLGDGLTFEQGPQRVAVPAGLQVTPQCGTWLICAASFSGREAVPLAIKMANILRERDKLPTYVLDYGAAEREKQKKEYEELLARNPGVAIRPRLTRIPDNAAVVIGGFGDDQERATKALPQVRKLAPPDLRLADGQPAYDSVVNYEPSGTGTQVKKATVNPFNMAFVMRNPTAPKPVQADRMKEELKFLRQLNSNEDYSLLKCKGEYTLLVKEYSGMGSMESQQEAPKGALARIGSAVGLGGGPETVLNASAMQAHELARFLRQYNFDAYVLHTRHSSLVTVGGFAGPEDDKLKHMQQQLASVRFNGGATTAEGTGPLDLMRTPKPVKIPR